MDDFSKFAYCIFTTVYFCRVPDVKEKWNPSWVIPETIYPSRHILSNMFVFTLHYSILVAVGFKKCIKIKLHANNTQIT